MDGLIESRFYLNSQLILLKVTIMNIFNLLNVFYVYEIVYTRDTVTQMTDFIVLSSVK